MITALSALFSSKKFLMAVVAMLVALGARYGLQLDPEMVALIVGVFATAIIGQGVADHGKEAAKINADSVSRTTEITSQSTGKGGGEVKATETVKSSTASSATQLTLLVVVVLGFTSLATLPGCPAAGDTARAVATEFTDCAKPSLKGVLDELVPMAMQVVKSAIGNDGKVDFDQIRPVAAPLVDAGKRCALVTALALASRPPKDGAPQSAGLTADPEQVGAGVAQMSTDLWGGSTYKPAGDK